MAPDDVKRKLTAIFSADVVGYSRLMGEDELATVETLTSHKETMGKLIRQYRGRVVDSVGDNLLAEFASVVDAVQCAVEVQQILGKKNETLPENRRMYFRIGINLGDVIEEGERIYGDGVNIAARVENLAEEGGISLSGTAYDQLGKKLPLGYEYLGEQIVKNIEKPVRVYRVLTEAEAAGKVIGEERPSPSKFPRIAFAAVVIVIIVAGTFAVWNFFIKPDVEPASVEKMAFPLPEKPSIAVLPFENISEDTELEYFCNGLTEDIITALSKTPKIFVIARNSTFTYKNKSVKVQRVAEDLGVRYVLEGSVQSSADRMRITAQLIDAITGHHIWAESYDREKKDVFTLQDEIAKNVLIATQVELTEGEWASLVSKGTNNLKAYVKVMQSIEYFRLMTRDDNIRSKQRAEEAIVLDPQSPIAWSMIAWTHLNDVLFGWSESPKKSMEEALKVTQKVRALGEGYGANYLMSYIYLLSKKYEKAITEVKKALSLVPNASDINAFAGLVHNYSNMPEEALGYIQKAMRLNPNCPSWYLNQLAIAYRETERYNEALQAFESLLARNEKSWNSYAHVGFALTYIRLGRQKEASSHVEEILKIRPSYNIEDFSKAQNVRYKNKAYSERTVSEMRKAGLPDHPPLPLPDKPSIAVLPFENMSGDSEQEYFSDGLTDDLITDLSKISQLFVIARNSTFQYKGKSVDVRKISRELGVRYVLEGSVRRAEDQIRINAQLIDAATGGHIWADRYDGTMGDVFSLQDRITGKIVAALAVKLTADEEANITLQETNNMAAYDAFLQGWAHYVRFAPDHFGQAIPYFEKAIELDPHYGRAYAALASIYWESFYRFWHASLGVPWRESKVRADKYLKAAMKNPSPLGYLVASKMLISSFEHKEATARAEQAVALDPNDANGYIAMAYSFIFSGKPIEALDFIHKAMRLDPQYPAHYLFVLGLAHFGMERFEEAEMSFERSLTRNPENYLPLIPLASTYAHLNRKQEAVNAIEKLRNTLPMVTMAFVRGCPLWKYKNPKDKKRLLDGLKNAGLPGSIYETLRKTG